MRLVTNPIVLRMLLVFVSAGFAFVVGQFLMRRLRRSFSEAGSFADGRVFTYTSRNPFAALRRDGISICKYAIVAAGFSLRQPMRERRDAG